MASDHFDQTAATWDDDPDRAAQAAEVARAVAGVAPVRPGARLLEYGAGTGLVTQALIREAGVGAVTLADSSAGMRSAMERKVASGDLPVDARVMDLDLERHSAPDERYDLVVASMVLHHVHDLERVVAGLASLVDAGGHLCVADLDTEDGSFHAHLQDFDGHPGFDRDHLATLLGATGLEVVSVADCTSIDKDGTTFPVFLAVATRPQDG